jgi:DNA-binding GntR family transcriptional regulator
MREQILSGRFPAGMRLKTEIIAEALGISRMPIRDALQQLHSEGLVMIRPNRSAIVTSLTTADIVELFEIRSVLEGLAARLACPRLTVAALDELEAILHRMNRARQDRALWLDCHEQFHETILMDCGRARLLHQIHNARNGLLPYLRIYVAAYPEMEVQGIEHEMLLSVAKRRNPELLEATIRDHIMGAAKGVVEFLSSHSQMTEGSSLKP